ncbi:MAG: hypothetical protein Kow0077_13350 [Anaerolineae bacterium]
MLGLMLIWFGINALGFDSPLGMLLLIGGLITLGVLMSQAQISQLTSYSPFVDTTDRRRSTPLTDIDFSLRSADDTSVRGGTSRAQRPAGRQGRMHRVAAKAIRKAGQNPADMIVAPVDIGILVYEDRESTPTLYRETRLPDEAEYIRPFMLLRSPRRAHGTLRFELYDGDGECRYVDETKWTLKAGETFVYPDTWLPMRTIEDVGGEWTLRIYAADILLAVHEFMWPNYGGGEFRQLLTGDGELSDDLAQELSRERLERLSLDDLLDDQPGGIIEVDPEAEAAEHLNQMLNRDR